MGGKLQKRDWAISRTTPFKCAGRRNRCQNVDDALPRSLLADAILKMRVAHRLDWAGELLGRRSEELAREAGSERRCLLVNEN